MAGLDFALGEMADAIRETTQRFAADRIRPLAAHIDAEDSVPRELWPEMGRLGLHGITVEEEFGGLSLGYLEHVVAVEEISRASASVGLSYGAHSNLCVNQIRRWGNADQKAYLRQQALFMGHEPIAVDSVYGWPATKPAFMNWGYLTATAGSDGKLYLLRMPSAKDSGVRYDVIDRGGSLATLTLPPHRYIIGFGTKTMYLVAVDDEGMMTLERYRWPGDAKNR